MDVDSPTALHKRLVELLRASGHNTLRVSQIIAILGINDDEYLCETLRELLARSRLIDYNAVEQTVRSVLPEHGSREDEDEAALLARSDVDVRGRGAAATSRAPPRSQQHRSHSRPSPHGGAGYRSDVGLTRANSVNRSFTGLSRRRAAGGWNQPNQRALDDAANYPGPVGRVGYVCVADELHLGKLEAYYHAQGYYTKFDFDVLHVRFAQPTTAATASAGTAAGQRESTGEKDRDQTGHRVGLQRRQEEGNPRDSHPLLEHDVNDNDDDDGGFHGDSHRVTHRSDTNGSPPPPPRPPSPGMRTASDTSPTHRDYGSTRPLHAAAASSAEGGEAPAVSTTFSAAGGSSSSSNSASVKQGFDLFIFPYGAVVWWGVDQRYFKIVENDYMLPHSAINHCMTNRYTTQLVNENYPVWCTYNLVRRDTLEVDDDFKARLRFDHFVIPYSRGEVATGSVLMLCASHALAQSAKIDYIELQVQQLADSCSPLPRELREKGTVSITERRLLQLRGEVLSYRLMLKSGSDLLDEPDFFWENSYLKPVFQATKEEFEIAERVEALDNKLDAANEILSMLAEDFSQRHGARLEWIVIWLVFVEVVIGILELLVDIRPWVRSSK